MSVWQKAIAALYCGLFILAPLIWLPNTSELFEFPKILLTYVFTVLICAAWATRMIVEKRIIFKRSLLDIPLLIFLLITLLSTLFSLDTHVSIYGYYSRWNGGLLSLLSYSLLYWAYVSNMNRKGVIFNIQYSIFGAVAVALYGAMEHFGFSPSCLITRGTFGVDCWVQDVKTRVFATLGQPNWLAAYLVALIFLPISALNSKFEIRNSKQIINFLILILLFATLLFTKSRSGLLAFGVSSLVYWGVLFINHKSKFINQFLVFAFSISLLALVFPNPLRDLVIKSATPAPVGPALEVGGTESGAIRKIVWTGAYRIWTGSGKNFLIGTGPETFAEAYYQSRPVEHNTTSEWELLYNKAHNEFLNQLATTGIIGLLSYLWLLVVMSRQLIKSLNHSMSNTTNQKDLEFDIGRFLILALLAGWLTIPLTNFWGFSVVITQLFLWLFPAMAIVMQVQSDKGPKVQSDLGGGQKLALLLCASATLYLVYLTGRYFLADVRYAAGTKAIRFFQATSDPKFLLEAYKKYSSAYALNRAEPAIASETAVAAAYLANTLRQTDATSAAALAQQSLSLSQISVSISPRHPNYYKSAARAYILLSDLDPQYLALAAAALERATQISPTDPRLPYNLGVIYSSLGATPSAIQQFTQALSLKPDFADAAKQLQEISSSSANQ